MTNCPPADETSSLTMPSNATIFLVRHGEKPDNDNDPGLSLAGQARANAYITYLASLPDLDGTLIKWQHLYASKDSSLSHRPRLTITPLSTAIGVTIDTHFADKDHLCLAQEFNRGRQKLAGAKILICWHHGEILALAKDLGADAAHLPTSSNFPSHPWPPTEFGWLLRLHYDADGNLDPTTTDAINEQLMYDDTLNPPGPSAR